MVLRNTGYYILIAYSLWGLPTLKENPTHILPQVFL